MKITPKQKSKLIDALNRMDDFAELSTQKNDDGEATQLAEDYNLLYNFISKHK